jgi:hypothetical protein
MEIQKFQAFEGRVLGKISVLKKDLHSRILHDKAHSDCVGCLVLFASEI